MRRRLTLTGSTLRARDAEFKALLADEIYANVWPHVIEGRLKPVMDQTFRWPRPPPRMRGWRRGTMWARLC